MRRDRMARKGVEEEGEGARQGGRRGVESAGMPRSLLRRGGGGEPGGSTARPAAAPPAPQLAGLGRSPKALDAPPKECNVFWCSAAQAHASGPSWQNIRASSRCSLRDSDASSGRNDSSTSETWRGAAPEGQAKDQHHCTHNSHSTCLELAQQRPAGAQVAGLPRLLQRIKLLHSLIERHLDRGRVRCRHRGRWNVKWTRAAIWQSRNVANIVRQQATSPAFQCLHPNSNSATAFISHSHQATSF